MLSARPGHAFMNARDELFTLYRRWRWFSEAEGEAIQLGAWEKVAQCQLGKRGLQAAIVTALEEAENQLSLWGLTPAEWERQLRSTVGELIALETRNDAWLAAQRRQVVTQQQAVEQARRSLRQVRGAYARHRDPAWCSYS